MTLQILIADDHDMVRETIAMFLDADGATNTVAASDLSEALEKIRAEGPFDLVLLDYTMPGMKGLEGLQIALEANGGKPVGLISGTGMFISLLVSLTFLPALLALMPVARVCFSPGRKNCSRTLLII